MRGRLAIGHSESKKRPGVKSAITIKIKKTREEERATSVSHFSVSCLLEERYVDSFSHTHGVLSADLKSFYFLTAQLHNWLVSLYSEDCAQDTKLIRLCASCNEKRENGITSNNRNDGQEIYNTQTERKDEREGMAQ